VTVIAAVTNGEVAWLGADSAGLDHTGLNWPANDKLIRLSVAGRERALLAFSGNGRLKGAMRDQLVLDRPDRAAQPLDVWARDSARRISTVAVDAHPPIVDQDNGEVDGIALLAFRGRIWRIAQDTAIAVPRAAAIGSGGDIALGVLRALDAVTPTLPMERMVETALDIVCREQSDCSAPVDIDCTT
jgi:hypothetical protein